MDGREVGQLTPESLNLLDLEIIIIINFVAYGQNVDSN